MKDSPPFQITPAILKSIAQIERLLGQVDASAATRPEPRLRKQNRIRTIKASLAIEGNTLSLEQVTAIFEKKKVAGPKREILEVQNAIKTYEQVSQWRSANERDFKSAHNILMKDLLGRPGTYRASAVGIIKGSKVSHVAPQSSRVPLLMEKLFQFLNTQKQKLPPLVSSAIIHYEIEFIHPFEDGNGRMGRLWHHLILQEYHPAFEIVPFESLIHENQKEYYAVLEKCDRAGETTKFIEFSLQLLEKALSRFLSTSPKRRMTHAERLEIAQTKFQRDWFSRKEYLQLFVGTSAPTASRDLLAGVKSKILTKRGAANRTEYRFC